MANITAPLTRIVTVLQGIPDVTEVIIGVPGSLPERLCAYVTLGRITLVDKAAGGLAQLTVEYPVTFARRIAGATAAAASAGETALLAAVGLFVSAMLAERRTNLNNTVASLELPDFSLAAEAEYMQVAGQEFRRLPCVIRTTIQETY